MSMTYENLMRFMEEELAIDPSEIECKTPLFSSGIIDSFSLVALMSAIEKENGFIIAPEDISLENFDSVERILIYLAKFPAQGDVPPYVKNSFEAYDA